MQEEVKIRKPISATQRRHLERLHAAGLPPQAKQAISMKNRKPVRSALRGVQLLMEAIDRAGYTMADVAAMDGSDRRKLYCWRSGDNSPTLSELEAVAALLGLQVALVPIGEGGDA